jgi:hypothetical protein
MTCTQPSRIMHPSVRDLAARAGGHAAPVFGVVSLGACTCAACTVLCCRPQGALRMSGVGALAAARVRGPRVLRPAGQDVFGAERR